MREVSANAASRRRVAEVRGGEWWRMEAEEGVKFLFESDTTILKDLGTRAYQDSRHRSSLRLPNLFP